VSQAGAAVIERLLQSDHPASRGHFPGNPIIPGAVLLSETVSAIQPGVDFRLEPLLITSAKFLHPARPGDRMLIEFSRTAGGEIRFACTVDGRPVLTGQMSCSSASTAT
jgi:3-hydroxymyristoyl/3-hydroxydecanoyl-(acyl carrier protein) dehydratase